MGAFFGSIVSWLLGFIFKKPPPASRLEVQTDRAAVAETKLTQQVQANVQTQKAAAADLAVDRKLADNPGSLWDDDGYQVGFGHG